MSIYIAKVIHRPGLSNIADYLSRRSAKIRIEKEKTCPLADNSSKQSKISQPPKKCTASRCKINNVSSKTIDSVPYKITLEEIIEETNKDAVMTELKRCLSKYRSIKNNKILKEYKSVYKELRLHESGIILRHDLILIPTALRNRAIT